LLCAGFGPKEVSESVGCQGRAQNRRIEFKLLQSLAD